MITATAESDRPLAAMVQHAGFGPVRFTLDDALEMVRHQILPEDISIELLNGQLVYRDRFELVDGVIDLGPKHSYVISALADLGRQIISAKRHIWVQCHSSAHSGTCRSPMRP